MDAKEEEELKRKKRRSKKKKKKKANIKLNFVLQNLSRSLSHVTSATPVGAQE